MKPLNPQPLLPRKRGEGEQNALFLSLAPFTWERDGLHSKQGEG